MESLDKKAKACETCKKPFGITRIRHACKRCNRIICADCTKGRIKIVTYDLKSAHKACLTCEKEYHFQVNFKTSYQTSWNTLSKAGQKWLNACNPQSVLAKSQEGYEETYKGYLDLIKDPATVNQFFPLIDSDLAQGRLDRERMNFSMQEFLYYNQGKLKQEQIRASISNVLKAFAIKFPTIGYSQGMNYLGMFLLTMMNEESAFWTLGYIVTNILPVNFYGQTELGIPLVGYQQEKFVLGNLIKEQLGLDIEMTHKITTLLDINGLAMLTPLLVNFTNFEVVYETWNKMLFNNNLNEVRKVIIQIVKQFLPKIKEKQIINPADFQYMTVRSFNSDEFKESHNIKIKDELVKFLVQKFRGDYSSQWAVNETKMYHELKRVTKFNKTQIKNLRSMFSRIAKPVRRQSIKANQSIVEEVEGLDKEDFKRLMTEFMSKDSEGKEMLQGVDFDQLFDSFDYSKSGKLDFKEFLFLVSMMVKGGREEKIQSAFSVFDNGDKGYLTNAEFDEFRQMLIQTTVQANQSNITTAFNDDLAKFNERLSTISNDKDRIEFNSIKKGLLVDNFIKYCETIEKLGQNDNMAKSGMKGGMDKEAITDSSVAHTNDSTQDVSNVLLARNEEFTRIIDGEQSTVQEEAGEESKNEDRSHGEETLTEDQKERILQQQDDIDSPKRLSEVILESSLGSFDQSSIQDEEEEPQTMRRRTPYKKGASIQPTDLLSAQLSTSNQYREEPSASIDEDDILNQTRKRTPYKRPSTNSITQLESAPKAEPTKIETTKLKEDSDSDQEEKMANLMRRWTNSPLKKEITGTEQSFEKVEVEAISPKRIEEVSNPTKADDDSDQEEKMASLMRRWTNSPLKKGNTGAEQSFEKAEVEAVSPRKVEEVPNPIKTNADDDSDQEEKMANLMRRWTNSPLKKGNTSAEQSFEGAQSSSKTALQTEAETEGEVVMEMKKEPQAQKVETMKSAAIPKDDSDSDHEGKMADLMNRWKNSPKRGSTSPTNLNQTQTVNEEPSSPIKLAPISEVEQIYDNFAVGLQALEEPNDKPVLLSFNFENTDKSVNLDSNVFTTKKTTAPFGGNPAELLSYVGFGTPSLGFVESLSVLFESLSKPTAPEHYTLKSQHHIRKPMTSDLYEPLDSDVQAGKVQVTGWRQDCFESQAIPTPVTQLTNASRAIAKPFHDNPCFTPSPEQEQSDIPVLNFWRPEEMEQGDRPVQAANAAITLRAIRKPISENGICKILLPQEVPEALAFQSFGADNFGRFDAPAKAMPSFNAPRLVKKPFETAGFLAPLSKEQPFEALAPLSWKENCFRTTEKSVTKSEIVHPHRHSQNPFVAGVCENLLPEQAHERIVLHAWTENCFSNNNSKSIAPELLKTSVALKKPFAEGTYKALAPEIPSDIPSLQGWKEECFTSGNNAALNVESSKTMKTIRKPFAGDACNALTREQSLDVLAVQGWKVECFKSEDNIVLQSKPCLVSTCVKKPFATEGVCVALLPEGTCDIPLLQGWKDECLTKGDQLLTPLSSYERSSDVKKPFAGGASKSLPAPRSVEKSSLEGWEGDNFNKVDTAPVLRSTPCQPIQRVKNPFIGNVCQPLTSQRDLPTSGAFNEGLFTSTNTSIPTVNKQPSHSRPLVKPIKSTGSLTPLARDSQDVTTIQLEATIFNGTNKPSIHEDHPKLNIKAVQIGKPVFENYAECLQVDNNDAESTILVDSVKDSPNSVTIQAHSIVPTSHTVEKIERQVFVNSTEPLAQVRQSESLNSASIANSGAEAERLIPQESVEHNHPVPKIEQAQKEESNTGALMINDAGIDPIPTRQESRAETVYLDRTESEDLVKPGFEWTEEENEVVMESGKSHQPVLKSIHSELKSKLAEREKEEQEESEKKERVGIKTDTEGHNEKQVIYDDEEDEHNAVDSTFLNESAVGKTIYTKINGSESDSKLQSKRKADAGKSADQRPDNCRLCNIF